MYLKKKFRFSWLAVVLLLIVVEVTGCGISGKETKSLSQNMNTVTASDNEAVTEDALLGDLEAGGTSHDFEDYPVPYSENETISAMAEEQEESPISGSAQFELAEDGEDATIAGVGSTQKAKGSWRSTTKSFNISVNSLITYGKKAIINFNDTIAVGLNTYNPAVSTIETEYGFMLSVIDTNKVKISFYNNGSSNVKPVKVIAEMYDKDPYSTKSKTEYTASGYSNCKNGFGEIRMEFSDGKVATAGVFKENGKLYVANVVDNIGNAKKILDYREKMEKVMAEYNVKPETSLNPDTFYPIVPIIKEEVKDTTYWINKSGEIVDPEWTDAHKLIAIYEHVIDNMAYDYWVLTQKKNGKKTTSRYVLYNAYKSTKYYPSTTYVGVCNDFAEIIAIMCRAQGIPCIKVSSSMLNHAWNYVYIADYGRWIDIDATPGVTKRCDSKDYNKKEGKNDSWSRYRAIEDKNHSDKVNDYLPITGNYMDMKRQGVSWVQK